MERVFDAQRFRSWTAFKRYFFLQYGAMWNYEDDSDLNSLMALAKVMRGEVN